MDSGQVKAQTAKRQRTNDTNRTVGQRRGSSVEGEARIFWRDLLKECLLFCIVRRLYSSSVIVECDGLVQSAHCNRPSAIGRVRSPPYNRHWYRLLQPSPKFNTFRFPAVMACCQSTR
jgi:hypothetical protein